MQIEIDRTQSDETNTHYAPLAVLCEQYRRDQRFALFSEVAIKMKTREFTPAAKLQQVLLSILSGCETLVEVNTKLKPERGLAQINGWTHFADQSTLSESLDRLSQTNIGQLRGAVDQISHVTSATMRHDWRGHLLLDFDLTGLPSGAQSEQGRKGYFGEKKRRWTPSRPCECRQISGNALVCPLSRQPTYRSLPASSSLRS